MGGAAWLGQLLRAGYAVQLRGGKAEAQMVYTIYYLIDIIDSRDSKIK
jgi:hypothetical protein